MWGISPDMPKEIEMKKSLKKLSLSRETVRHLGENQLQDVAGASLFRCTNSCQNSCDTITYVHCYETQTC
jgi:hypothetical protein